MIFLETLIFILLIFLFISVIIPKQIEANIFIGLWALVFLLIVIHLIAFGSRWQLYTLYFSVLLLGVFLYFSIIKHISLNIIIRRILLITSIVMFVISGLSVLSFPMYHLPEPNGDFLIGTESFIIEDETRLELYSEDPNDYRKTKIQIWYPAETIEGFQQAPWLEDGQVIARALSKDIGLPFFALDHTAEIMSNSYLKAPISKAFNQYPVVILSHGWRGFRNIHTDYAEELASLGYIVVGIDHSYGSVATVFEDETIYLNPDALPERDDTPDFIDYANQLVNTYASDIIATLDYLEVINEVSNPSRFSGKFDLGHIGLIGHSTGGGADVAVALSDDRIDSVIGLDAWVEPLEENIVTDGLTIPSMFIRSGAWETGENNENLLLLIENSSDDTEFYQIDGTTHYDFAMVYMYSPLTPYIGFSGSIEDRYLVSILKSMITDFFDETLKGDSNSQIDESEWEEVRIINE